MRVFNWIWSPVCFVLRGSAMRTSEFDSSSEEEVGEEQLTPLHISWWVSAALASQEVSQHCKRQQLRCAVLCSQVTLVRGGVLAVSGHLWTSRWDQLCTQPCHNVPAFIGQRFSSSFVSIQVANTKTSAGVWRETLVRWPACESDPNISFFHFLLCVFTHSWASAFEVFSHQRSSRTRGCRRSLCSAPGQSSTGIESRPCWTSTSSGASPSTTCPSRTGTCRSWSSAAGSWRSCRPAWRTTEGPWSSELFFLFVFHETSRFLWGVRSWLKLVWSGVWKWTWSSRFSVRNVKPPQDLKHSVFPSYLSCYGGLGRSGLSKNLNLVLLSPPVESSLEASFTPPSDLFYPPVAACLMLHLSETLTENKVIEILREHRGGGAIQTVKVRTGSDKAPVRRFHRGL